jgi:hypothetical protein
LFRALTRVCVPRPAQNERAAHLREAYQFVGNV